MTTRERRTQYETLLALMDELREAVREVAEKPPGVRPTVGEFQERVSGILLGLGVLADRLRVDQDLRPYAEEALEALNSTYTMGSRIGAASHALEQGLSRDA